MSTHDAPRPHDAPPRELAADFEVARRLHRKHGTSYYFATQMFPRAVKLATYAVYGFLRVPDEIVDNLPQNTPAERDEVRRQLSQWQCNWERAYQSGASDDAVLRVASYAFHEYSIPYEYSEAFLDAMRLDLEKTTYENYEELRGYMYGSAAVVGLMMTHVIGFSQERALSHAEQLGYAMQLTNFLRDVDEDFQMRGRVYLPQDELAAHGLSTQDIAARRFNEKWRDFAQEQAARAQQLYDEAEEGIPMLSPHGRLAVRTASRLYGAILGKIAAQDWNVFAGRARTSKAEKIKLLARAVRETQLENKKLSTQPTTTRENE